MTTPTARSVSHWALIFTAVFGVAAIALAAWSVWLLSSQSWCSQSLGSIKYVIDALKVVPNSDAAGGCLALQRDQIGALKVVSMMSVGSIAVSLICLIAVAILGARLEIHGPGGIGGGISQGEAVQAVADAAQNKADAIKEPLP